jgi:hypothetical protein
MNELRNGFPPTCLSSDHDSQFEFGQWRTNLRILDVTELRTQPVEDGILP